MVDQRSTTLLAGLLAIGLFAFGCGDDGGTDDGNGNGGQDTGVMDTGSGGGGDDGGMTDPDMGGGDDTSGECQACPKDEFVVDDAPSCSDDSPPERCGKDRSSFDNWGPASAVTTLELTTDRAKECCFDITGDGETDNALAELLGLLSNFGDLNVDAEIAKNIVANEPYDDDLVLLLEHQNLEELGQNNPFLINFFLGDYANMDARNYLTKADDTCNFDNMLCDTESQKGKEFTIDPETFDGDGGVQPQAQVPDATFPEGNNIEAGPGKVIIDISSDSLGDISLTIRGATIEGVVNEGESDLADDGDGVVIEDGKLGGYVLAKDIIALVDSLISDCDCLGLEEGQDAITFPTQGDDSETDLKPPSCGENSTGDECTVGCTEAVTSNSDACSDADGVCGFTGTVCDQLSTVLGFTDLDIDGDGTPDAFSAGAIIEATGAKITGVTQTSGGN